LPCQKYERNSPTLHWHCLYNILFIYKGKRFEEKNGIKSVLLLGTIREPCGNRKKSKGDFKPFPKEKLWAQLSGC
jgi:hypothetical protein